MTHPLVFVDFHNCDVQGRVRLTCVGTREDLQRLGLTLKEGMVLDLHNGEPDLENLFTATGVVRFSAEENIWVAEFEWT